MIKVEEILRKAALTEFVVAQIKTRGNLCDFFCGYLGTEFTMCYIFREGLKQHQVTKDFTRTKKCREFIKK